MLISLCFVPVDYVIPYFNILEFTGIYNDYSEFMNYFTSTWIGSKLSENDNDLKRKQPKHPISTWNFFEYTKSMCIKTNNHIEGWNRGFQELINTSNASIFALINAIKIDQSNKWLLTTQCLAGNDSRPLKKCSQNK